MAEVILLERDVRLLEATQGRLHASHLSTGESLDVVRRAKQRGLRLTAGAAPHNFALNELDVGDYRTFAKVKPPLRVETDRKAVVGYLRACSKGMQFLLDPANYDAAASLLAKYNPVEAQDRALARKKFAAIAALAQRPAGVPFMHCDPKSWESGVALMEKIGLIKPDAKPMSAYYTNELVKQI